MHLKSYSYLYICDNKYPDLNDPNKVYELPHYLLDKLKRNDTWVASLNPCLVFYAAHPWNLYLTNKATSMLELAYTIWQFWIFRRVEVTEWCTQFVGIVIYFIFQGSHCWYRKTSLYWSFLAASCIQNQGWRGQEEYRHAGDTCSAQS